LKQVFKFPLNVLLPAVQSFCCVTITANNFFGNKGLKKNPALTSVFSPGAPGSMMNSADKYSPVAFFYSENYHEWEKPTLAYLNLLLLLLPNASG
jgi:hypothetical protein